MKHLVRAGVLLLAVLILAFVVPRVIPIPVSLEEYGFYPKQSEENTHEWASLPLQYADPSVCSDCHQDKHDSADRAAVDANRTHPVHALLRIRVRRGFLATASLGVSWWGESREATLLVAIVMVF